MDTHPNFEKYMEYMVAHPAYSGLFYERGKDGRVKWVVTGKSPKGQLRQAWWDKKCVMNGIPIQKGCYAVVARAVHPTGRHVCQCCGQERSIYYEYPTKKTAGIINSILGTDIDTDNDSERVLYTIGELVEKWCRTDRQVRALADAFGLPAAESKTQLIQLIYSELVYKESSLLSPGVMSNSPDRFDGFHSYALCCRTSHDKGRDPQNMDTYTQDRRAYEDWSDGNYALANRLMGEFRKQPAMKCPVCGNVEKMSADHIGPISLGFCHSIHFAPMCGSCNSSKNNRFTKSDVDRLLDIEAAGDQVISWHSKFIWDALKHSVKNDKDAKFASSVMAKCHQNTLCILAMIYRRAGRDFLMRYLHPEYSLTDYWFENVDLEHLEKLIIHSKPCCSKNRIKNQERYERIAFESLDNFLDKTNRKNSILISEDSAELANVLEPVLSGDFDEADRRLLALLESVSGRILLAEQRARARDEQ